jgi:hypothetical protein
LRSRLLLDEDQATRGVGLGRIYDDLGFQQLGINEATAALQADPASSAAHRFLSDLYRGEPRLKMARISNLLQAQLLQPVGLNPIQPSLSFSDLNLVSVGGPARVSFDEFTALFQRNGLRLDATGALGTDETYGEELALTALVGRSSISAGQLHYSTDGFRPDADVRPDNYTIFAQTALRDDLSLQTEYRRRETSRGDREFGFLLPADPNLEQSTDEDAFRLGAHWQASPHLDVLVSGIVGDLNVRGKTELVFPGIEPGTEETLSISDKVSSQGVQIESQMIARMSQFTANLGVSVYKSDELISLFDSVEPCEEDCSSLARSSFNKEGGSAYSYASFRPVHWAWLTLGASGETYDEPGRNLARLLPKVGANIQVTWRLQLRGAIFETIRRGATVDQTLEPTQIAGFNQHEDEFPGTHARTMALAADLRLSERTAVGLEWRRRDASPPFFFLGDEEKDLESNLADREDNSAGMYLNWMPTDRISFTARRERESFRQKDRDATGLPVEIDTSSLPLSLRYFRPGGWFGQVGVTFVNQEVSITGDSSAGRDSEDEGFVLVDGAVGYRASERHYALSLEAANLLDADFRYQDNAFRSARSPTLEERPNPRFLPSRSFLARLNRA